MRNPTGLTFRPGEGGEGRTTIGKKKVLGNVEKNLKGGKRLGSRGEGKLLQKRGGDRKGHKCLRVSPSQKKFFPSKETVAESASILSEKESIREWL